MKEPDKVLRLPPRIDFRSPADARYYERRIAPAFKALRRRYRLKMRPLFPASTEHEDPSVV